MKFLVEFNPPPKVKNEFEKIPELQKKMGEAMESIKPLSAWFTLRRGMIVVEAGDMIELSRKLAPLFHLFKTDPVISPAISLEEFAAIPAAIGEEARRLGL